MFWLLDFGGFSSTVTTTLPGLPPAFSPPSPPGHPEIGNMGNRFQLQQRNCFRFSRNSFHRLTNYLTVKELAEGCPKCALADKKILRRRAVLSLKKGARAPPPISALITPPNALTVWAMFAALFLLVVVVFYRVVSGFAGSADFHWLHNFAPLAAVALSGAVYLPRRMAALLPMAMLLVSDLILNFFHYHQPFFTLDILPRYLALALITGLGFALRGRATILGLLGASVAGSLLFFVITNTGSWLYDPGYAKTGAGWLQAMTIGLPGYPPTLWFYRFTLLGDVFYTLLFAGCMAVTAKKENVPQFATAEQLARS